jgi:hypothetical protein
MRPRSYFRYAVAKPGSVAGLRRPSHVVLLDMRFSTQDIAGREPAS